MVSFSLVMPILLGTVGLSVDLSLWVKQKDALQAVADAAALSAAVELTASGAFADVTAAAVTAARNSASVNGPATNAEAVYESATGAVAVTVTQPAVIAFGSLFGIEPFTLQAVAKSGVAFGASRTCILALDEAAKTGVSVSGSGIFEASGCKVHSNATSDQSIVVGGDATVVVSQMCAAGQTVVNGSSAAITGTRRDGCGAMDDPLKGEAMPGTTDSCTAKNLQIVSQGDLTLSPGTYCGGLRASAKGTITLQPGIYVIKDGPLKLTADVKLTGDDVGLFLTGNKAVVELTGQTDVHLSARETGTLAGIVLASDRSQTGNLESRIAGGASLDLAGTVYLPQQDLIWRGNSRSDEPSRVTQIIAATVDIAGTSTIKFETLFEEENYPPVETISLIPYLSY